MQFIDYNQLYRDVIDYATRVPEVDAILGIPRSGMLPAAMLATHLNKPLGFLNTDGTMQMLKGGARDSRPLNYTRFLALDDSTDSGHTLDGLKHLTQGLRITYGAIYYSENTPHRANDIYGRLIKQPRMFAWNFMNHGLLEQACVDIDGVLCRDPSPEECDWGEKYLKFLSEVPVRYAPKYKIRHLVTGRLEKYREETEDWLSRKYIKYDNLTMRFDPSIDIGEMKRDFYKDSKCIIFIESSEHQAKQIAKVGPVICTDNLTQYDSS